MKTKLFSILAASALAFASCTDNDTPAPTPPKDAELSGDITKDMTLDANVTYTMSKAVFVKSGATLTIPAGTVIKAADSGTSIFLLVEKGGKIMADGTAAKPIVFTSASATPKSGDWGGVLINGSAPLSHEAGKTSDWGTEISSNIRYGGETANDNSGVLNYVKIEYTGARIDGAKEHNGLTLNGVGNGTKISNIYLNHGADDAIEFFGGSVNASNILVVNADDDMFDFTQGYNGTLTNVYGIREANYQTVTSDPRGIEADGNLDGKNENYENQSNFTINGITIINNAADINGSKVTQMMTEVMKIRRKAKATITNAYIKFGGAAVPTAFIDMDDAGDASSSITYTVDPANGLDKIANKNKVGATLKAEAGNKGADVSAFTWTGYKF